MGENDLAMIVNLWNLTLRHLSLIIVLLNVLFNISATFPPYGGEMASTEIKKLRLHTELLPARKKGWN